VTCIARRRLLKLSGAGAIAAGSGGFDAILAAGRAPAYAQGTTIHWLRWSDFVPASDRLLKEEIVPQCAKALGIKLNLETINANDIQARITAAIQSGSGPDIFFMIGNWPQLYIESLSDVTDVAEDIGNAQAGYYDVSGVVANDGRKWIGVPWAINGVLLAYRKSWFAEIGYGDGKYPQTWEEFRASGKKLKAMGRPFGQTLGHTWGDAPSFWYPYLWSWGSKEVEYDGRTVVLNRKTTVDSVKFAVGLWQDAFDEGGLAWDDSSNNRAFLAGTISATSNGASIYVEAKRKPESYLSENGMPLWQDILHAPLPKGAGGQFNLPIPCTHGLMSYSRNQKAAKDFLRWVSSKEIYGQWFTSQQGYCSAATKDWEQDPVWNLDPVPRPFRDIPYKARLAGYSGPPGPASAEVLTKYIIVDMYAKAAQGMPAEDAVKWAHQELVKIYA
jgi:multiple sugar transport system substrate-binding protein